MALPLKADFRDIEGRTVVADHAVARGDCLLAQGTRCSALIEVSQASAQTLGPIAATLAHGEGLTAHARAAELRIKP